MKNIDKLPQVQYTCLAADETNNEIWLGTKDDLKRHKLETNYWEHFDKSTTNTILDDTISAICTGQEYIYVLTDNGINIFHKDTKSWKLIKRLDSEINGSINSIDVDKNNLILCTEGNISLYAPEKDQWLHYSLPDELKKKKVKTITPLKDNQFGLIIENTLYIYDTKKSDCIFNNSFDETLNCLIYDHFRDCLWLGLRNGIRCLERAKKEWRKNFELNEAPNITRILINKEFIFGIGDAKIFKTKLPESIKDIDPLEKLINNIDDNESLIWDVLQLIEPGEKESYDFEVIDAVLDDDWLWIATKMHGLIEHEFKFNEVNTYFPQLFTEQVSEAGNVKSFQITMFSALQKSLVIISNNDLWHFKKETTDWIQITQPESIYPYPIKIGKAQNRLIKDINSFSKSEIWFIINEQTKMKKKKQNNDLPNVSIQCLASDENGLSIGTLDGLLRYSYDTYIWKKYSKTEGLKDDVVIKVITSSSLTLAITKKGLSILNHSTGLLNTWKPGDLKLDISKNKDEEIKIHISDDIAAIGQKGSFQLYSKFSSETEGYNWKSYSLPNDLNKKSVSTFLRENDVLWIGGDGFFGAFHMDEEEWIQSYPISGEIVSILLEPEKIWLLLHDGIYWAERKKSKIISSLNDIPISNAIDFRFINDQLLILTRDSVYRLVPPETSDHKAEVGESDDDINTKQENQTDSVEDFGYYPGKSKEVKPGTENIGFFSDKNNIFVLTAGATINRYNIYENEWSAYNRWTIHNCPIPTGSRKVVRFDKDRLQWSLTALPFYIFPLEVSQPNMGASYIGSTIVVGDTLWYIARDNEDTAFGKLKKLNLKNGTVTEIEDLPPVGMLHLDKKDVLAVSNNQLFLYKNASTKYTCFSMGYKFDDWKMTVTDIIVTIEQNKMPERPAMPIRIATSLLDSKNLWLSCYRVKNPADSSKRHTLTGGGLFHYNRINQKWSWLLRPEDNFNEDDITSICSHDDGLLLGTKSKLHFFNTSKEEIVDTITQDDGVLPSKIRLIENIHEDIWIATHNGYTIFNENDLSMIKYSEPMKAKYIRQRFDRATKAWVDEEEPIEFEPPYLDIYAILNLEKNVLFGTSLGFHEYIKDKDTWLRSTISDGISNQRIHSISKWNDHIILGTSNGIFIIPHGVI